MESRKRCLAALFVVWSAVGLGGCVDDTVGRGGTPRVDAATPRADAAGVGPGPVTPWAIAVVGSDYASTSLSIVDRDGPRLFRENVVSSGSAAPGLSIALSGDVVMPRALHPDHGIVLLDRYPNSVLTWVAPEDFAVQGQMSVATGFAANPRDVLWLSADKAYVTRYERNPAPGREPYDEGDDILIIDPRARAIRGRIPLGAADTPADGATFLARPDQMVWAQERVWVTLNHLSADFARAGEGRVVAIDPALDRVVQSVALPGVTNCTAVVHVPQRGSLYVSCSGLLAPGATGQRAGAGVAEVDLRGEAPVARLVRRATDGGGGQPYGFDLDVAAGRFLLVSRLGDLAQGIPDRLVAIDLDGDRDGGAERVVHEASSPFGLGGVLVDEAAGRVYVGDASPASPAVHLYDVADGAFRPAGTLVTHPTVGLPPRQLRFY